MRTWLAILGIVALLCPPLAAYWLRQGPAEVSSPNRLVILTPNNQDIRNEFRWAFSDWHLRKYGTRVELEFLTPGGTNDIKRQLETYYRPLRDSSGKLPPEDSLLVDANLVWGGGDVFFERDLKPLGILVPLPISPKVLKDTFPQPTLGGVNLYDRGVDKAGRPQPRWVGTCLSGFGILYNPDLYGRMGISPPTSWSDLADDRLRGAVELADPTHSGSAAVAAMMIYQKQMADAEKRFFELPVNRGIPAAKLRASPQYAKALDAGWKRGMSDLLRIAANTRYFSDSASEVVNDVSNGQAAAAMAIDFYGYVVEQTVGESRARFVLPQGATAITPDPIAVLYGTRGDKLTWAGHFLEFLLSPEGQRLWILKVGQAGGPRTRALCRSPIRRGVYADQTGWVGAANYFALAGSLGTRSAWFATLSDLGRVWAAAWIDNRDELRNAVDSIANVRDEQVRQRLMDELADLPITRQDVDRMMAKRKAVEADPKQDADQWKARLRVHWVEVFREHYRRVAMEAAEE